MSRPGLFWTFHDIRVGPGARDESKRVSVRGRAPGDRCQGHEHSESSLALRSYVTYFPVDAALTNAPTGRPRWWSNQTAAGRAKSADSEAVPGSVSVAV